MPGFRFPKPKPIPTMILQKRARRLAPLTCASALLVPVVPAPAAPLRVDLNTDYRADMNTYGWENWMLGGNQPKASFGEITASLTASKDLYLGFFGDKSMVVRGVTVGADAAVAIKGDPPALELRLEGLEPGPHTFVGFHHDTGGGGGVLTVSIGDRKVEGIEVVQHVDHDDDLATSFLEFEAKAGEPVVVRIAAGPGQRAPLSAFALDVSDPRHKARRPTPPEFDRHADGDEGTVALSWRAAESAATHRVFLASDRDPEVAVAKLEGATEDSDSFLAEVEGSSYEAPVVKHDSLLHYAWRVDSIDAEGGVTPGDVWSFRVRHPAFPGAEGYGGMAIGGRGGRVIHVTSLEDSGPGTLREAVEATGPRTVVFDVSGLISLQSRLVFKPENEFLTVAGQTAPGKGICLRNHTFGGLGGRDTVVRFIRMRLGDLEGGRDGMGLASSDHCIIDHCSISWTIDESFSSRDAKNITFQRNIISEALNPTGHGYAGSISGDIGSFHHNLLAHNEGRNWSLAGGINQANRHAGRLDIRNMVVYNWKSRTTDGGARQVNFVNNYYKPGPATELKTYLNPQFENPAFGPQQYYVEGNVMEGVCGPEGPKGPFKGVAPRGEQEAAVTVDEPFFPSRVTTHSAEEAYENVLADVGCNVPMLDDHDQRILKEVREGTFTYKGSRSGLPGLPDTQEDVGGWEEYPEVRRPDDWDTDGDGMPGKWEAEKGLDPEDPSDGPVDPDGDGYTNLEDYLNWLAAGNSPE